MQSILLGTEDGIIRLGGNGGKWEPKGETRLEGKKVLCARTVEGRIVATCYGDGVYISRDSGTTWKPVKDPRLKKVRCLVQDSWNGRETLFAGTEPVGLYTSRDGGESWSEIAAVRELHVQRQWTYPVPGVDPHVRDVLVDDLDRDTLYVSIQVGGILVGRQDGTAWEEMGRGLNPDVHKVVMEPSDRSVFYAGTGEEGIFISRDSGREWQRCRGMLPWTYTIPFESWGPKRLVAGMGCDLPNAWSRQTGAEAALVLTNDGGRSWSTSMPEKPLQSMIMALTFASSPENTVLVGTGVTIGAIAAGKGELYKVDLTTRSWTQLNNNLPGINFILEV
jgi:photosystem II stability/assembly factor-like uncharacterized protein